MRTSAMWGRLAACGGLSTRLQTLPNTGRPAPVASRRAGCHPAPQGAGRSVPGKLCSFGPKSAPHAGFTLLEVLVATLIMAIAITALLSNLSVSLRTAGRLTDNDRAAMVARAKMDELLLDATIPHGAELHGKLDPALTGWSQAGWRAVVRVFEKPPGAGPGVPVLERIDLEVWWDASGGRRTFALDAYRRGILTPADMGMIQ